MGAEPDRIRAQIEETRAELTGDVDRLADRTSPKRIVRRRWEGVRDKAKTVKETVMGASQDAASAMGGTASTVGDKVSDVADSVRETPQVLAGKTRGNPLAVGVIAFGAGLLAASLLPESEAEKRWGRQAAEHADEMLEPVKESVRQLGSEVGEAARDAAGRVGQVAKDAAQETTATAKDAAQETREMIGTRG